MSKQDSKSQTTKQILLKTQESTCVNPQDIGLSYDFANFDYQNKNVSNYIFINTKFNMEQCKINGDNKISSDFYNHTIKPFRKCGKNNGIIGDKKTEKSNYLKLAFNDGYIPTCNVDIDSDLTRSNMEPKPIDRFAEKITGGRMHIMPKNETLFLNINKFQISSQNIGNPTKPHFFPDKQGVSARDFQRKSSKFYKQKK
jgi:hypothetical protein